MIASIYFKRTDLACNLKSSLIFNEYCIRLSSCSNGDTKCSSNAGTRKIMTPFVQ